MTDKVHTTRLASITQVSRYARSFRHTLVSLIKSKKSGDARQGLKWCQGLKWRLGAPHALNIGVSLAFLSVMQSPLYAAPEAHAPIQPVYSELDQSITAELPARALRRSTAPWLRDFDTFFQATVLMNGVPGAAYAVVQRDGIIMQGTYGYARPKPALAVDANTVFRVASVSKTFAATLAGLLVAEGKLHWDEPITRYAPDFHIKGRSDAIHLEHLLGQSTGLPAYAYDNFIEEGLSFAEIIAKFKQLTPICRPGDCYTYQNSAFSLIQPAVEQAAAQDYGSLLTQRIFQPLTMNDASVGYEDFLRHPKHALPHVKKNGVWRPTEIQPNYYRVAPAAGVNASITDLAKWLMAQLGARPDVLPSAVLADVTQPRVRTQRDLKRKHWRDHLSDAHYALGWRIYELGEHELIYHGGWVSGFRTDIAYSRQYDLGLAIVVNAEGSTVTELSTQFWGKAFAQATAALDSGKALITAPPSNPSSTPIITTTAR